MAKAENEQIISEAVNKGWLRHREPAGWMGLEWFDHPIHGRVIGIENLKDALNKAK